MRVVISCVDGTRYVRVASNGLLDAAAVSPNLWETFEMEEFPDGRFALRTLAAHPQSLKYVRAEGGGGGNLRADRDVAKDHEKFTRVALDGKVAVRTHKGNFWRAQGSGGTATLDCGATVRGPSEIFTIQVV